MRRKKRYTHTALEYFKEKKISKYDDSIQFIGEKIYDFMINSHWDYGQVPSKWFKQFNRILCCLLDCLACKYYLMTAQ